MCQTYPYELWCSILWAGFENEMQEKRVIIEFESLHQSCCRRQLVFASGPQQPTLHSFSPKILRPINTRTVHRQC